LKDAAKNHEKILKCYRASIELSAENAVPLPDGDLASQIPIVKSLGMLEQMAQGFAKAMDDDFNSREAVAKVLAAVREMSAMLSQLDGDDVEAFANHSVEWLEDTAGDVLGILPTKEQILADSVDDPRRAEIADEVEALLVRRTLARSAKDWGEADSIRDKLNELGVKITDTPEGPSWDLSPK
jgi:cysteinyl-tRNA synthetase